MVIPESESMTKFCLNLNQNQFSFNFSFEFLGKAQTSRLNVL